MQFRSRLRPLHLEGADRARPSRATRERRARLPLRRYVGRPAIGSRASRHRCSRALGSHILWSSTRAPTDLAFDRIGSLPQRIIASHNG